MRRPEKDYEDKAMSSRREKPPAPAPEPSESSGPPPEGGSAPAPSGPAVDVRPSERELAEQAQEGKPRPSERENAEEIARRTQEAQEGAAAPAADAEDEHP